jgi:hypothetical protein
MIRLNQVNMSQTLRRFGLPQVALLTGAFATAMLLAIIFRPAKPTTMAPASTAALPASHAHAASAERDLEPAQAQLAAAMARFAIAAAKDPEAQAIAPTPEPAALTQPPSTSLGAPTTLAQMTDAQTQIPPAIASTKVPDPVPLSEPDLRRLNSKAAQALRDGDIYGARLVLERAIAAGDSDALLTLAETYDPKSLARMNVKSVKADPARARALYTLAIDRGVGAARARLDALDR